MKPYHNSDLQIMTNAKYEPKSAKSENKYVCIVEGCMFCMYSQYVELQRCGYKICMKFNK